MLVVKSRDLIFNSYRAISFCDQFMHWNYSNNEFDREYSSMSIVATSKGTLLKRYHVILFRKRSSHI